ncbi:MAG TPA: TetR/AcrR family transcriptional regulator C-terminal domain-containing protein [Candidatus Saccharimonadales bacterium]|nr:TetR/AcrR family transcriptional regulator C-terminal domain-containing protein [Candidatus Saccharimonadales bacterium]
MNREDKRARDLARLEAARRHTQQRLAQQQERLNKRFDRMRDRLDQKYGQVTDQQQRIIAAALELLKADGLNNLSLRKLARQLNMQAPALYWHFQNKEVLIDYMAEAILNREFQEVRPRSADEPWQDWLSAQMMRLRKAMLAYPDGARVVAGAHLYPAVTLGKLFECTLESLVSAGLDLRASRHILMTATTYTFGFVIEEQAMPNDEEIRLLSQELSGESYPLIVEAMREAHCGRRGMEDDYRVGLSYIIRGAAA